MFLNCSNAKLVKCIQHLYNKVMNYLTGDWVKFQNCHLVLDFMSKLNIMLKNTELEWNPEFGYLVNLEMS